jgi:hypothetical protein
MPQPLIGTWATAANYGAGSYPWSGGPTKVQNSAGYWIPGTGASAPEMNFELNQAFANINSVQIAGGDSTIAQNWQPQFVAESGAYTLNATAWNATLNLWVCANTYNSSSFNFFSTLTGADATTTVNFGTGFTPTGTVAGISCDNSGCSYMTRISGGLGYVETITAAAVQTSMGAFNAATAFPIASPSGQSFAMGVLVSGSASGSEIFYLTNASHTAEVTGLSLTNAVVAASATTCAAVYIGSSGICSVTMVTGGVTTTLSISGTIGTDIPIALAYGTTTAHPGGAFVLVTQPSGGGSVRNYYLSDTGNTYTYAYSTSSAQAAVKYLCGCGSLWLGLVAASTPDTGVIVWSPDGQSWYPSQVYIVPNGANSPSLAMSPVQAAICYNDTVGTVRFSLISGQLAQLS